MSKNSAPKKRAAKTGGIVEVARQKRLDDLRAKVKKGVKLNSREFRELQQYEAEQLSKSGKAGHVVPTQEKVAQFFKVSARTIQNWIKDGMPVGEGGVYDLDAIQAWRVERRPGSDEQGSQGKSHWDKELTQWKALKAELDYQEKLGSLIPREIVDRERTDRIRTVKTALLGLAPRLAPQVAGQDVKRCEELIKFRLEEIIADFARGGAGVPEVAPNA